MKKTGVLTCSGSDRETSRWSSFKAKLAVWMPKGGIQVIWRSAAETSTLYNTPQHWWKKVICAWGLFVDIWGTSWIDFSSVRSVTKPHDCLAQQIFSIFLNAARDSGVFVTKSHQTCSATPTNPICLDSFTHRVSITIKKQNKEVCIRGGLLIHLPTKISLHETIG